MKSILFVDDERNVLDGLKRMLFSHRNIWRAQFACGGSEALTLLAASQFDVIVADMRMPGMNGAELLGVVAEQYPQMVRIILSGTWDQDLRLQAARTAHQYLSKPCSAELLKSTLDRAFALRSVLIEPALKELISRTASLPSAPGIYLELSRILESPDASAQQIGNTISRDVAMAAKVLQLVNSSFFGAGRPIADPKDAVVYLGVDAIRALALSVSAFSMFQSAASARFSIDDLQRHSIGVASIARRIAAVSGCAKEMADQAFAAGLLHDIGRLLLATNHPRKCEEVLDLVAGEKGSLVEAEQRVFGTTHAEVGSYLLWLWGLPDAIVEAVAFHHNPSACPASGFCALTAVHVADGLAIQKSGHCSEAASAPDIAYLERIRMADQYAGWSTAADSFGEVAV